MSDARRGSVLDRDSERLLTPAFVLVLCLQFCFGLSYSTCLLYPSLNALGAEGIPRARRGAVMSYFFGCFGAGSALWVLARGVVAKANGYPVVFLATGVLVWSSIAFVPKKALGLSA